MLVCGHCSKATAEGQATFRHALAAASVTGQATIKSQYGRCVTCGADTLCMEIVDLTAPSPTWPKRLKTYIHSDKESMWDAGSKLGLTGEALSLFRHALNEVTVEIDVNEDGTYKIISTKE